MRYGKKKHAKVNGVPNVELTLRTSEDEFEKELKRAMKRDCAYQTPRNISKNIRIILL
jgi:hypothetical protein